jgi:hypothetical protein
LRFATTRSLLAWNIALAEDGFSARIKFMKWTARIAIMLVAGFLLGSPWLVVSASATPAGAMHDATSQTAGSGLITKVWYDCEGCYHHSRWRSHHRHGSEGYGEGCHNRHLSHCRSGSHHDWHSHWRSHRRWGSDHDWHSRWRSHYRWNSEY